MKKTLLLMMILLIALTGCKNEEEDEKNEYLAMKSDLLAKDKFDDASSMNCDITFSLDRLDEEKVTYSVVLDNPKENMHDIRAIVVHNYYTEEVFPTVGLFDKPVDLLVNSQDEKDNSVELVGNIETTDDIDNLDLELKILIEYKTDSGEVKDIYYKTT